MLTVAKASAGAGKTFLLAKTYIDCLFAQRGSNRHRHILAVTFTIKATAEMKQRIIRELHLLAMGKDSAYADFLMKKHRLSPEQLQEQARTILFNLLQDYSACRVNTIDAFFQQIIRSFAHELNLPGSYNVELDAKQIRETAVDEFLFNLPKDTSNPAFQVLQQIVEDKLETETSWDPTNEIYSISKELHNEYLQLCGEHLYTFLQNKEAVQAYRKQLIAIQTNYEKQLRDLEKQVTGYLQENNLKESDFSNGKNLFAPFHYSPDDIWGGKYKDPPKRLQNVLADSSTAVKKADTHLLPYVDELIPLFRQFYDLITGEPLRKFITAKMILKYFSYLSLLTDIRRVIDEDNLRLNRLPLADANALLSSVVGTENDVPFVYEKVGVQLHNFLIDEFQDTSTMQWNNFLPLLRESLATDNADLIVGDVKQSIYRWRGSNYELLQSGVQSAFPKATVQSMGDNWRSDCEVVAANNEMLAGLAKAANDDFNSLYNHPTGDLHNRIASIYEDVKQTPQRNTEKGYVQVQFFDEKEHDLPNNEMLRIIHDIQQRGMSLSRLAILVRKGKEAVEVASFLQKNNIPVISSEGLRLSSSLAIQALVAAMHYMLQPDDATYLFFFRYAYSRFLNNTSPSQTMSATLASSGNEPFTPKQWEDIHNLHTLPLYQMVLGLETTLSVPQSDPYVLAFNDVVLTYSQSRQADLFSFIDWWQQNGSEKTLPPPADANAVQILTIHKSKGLEFDQVIIPYFDWEKAIKKGNTENLLWVKAPTTFPYSHENTSANSFPAPPILPVSFSHKLAFSLFADDYWQELQSLYVDNLNIAYVAFTRAKRELYVLIPKKNSIGTLLQTVLQPYLQGNIFERGEKPTAEPTIATPIVSEPIETPESPSCSASVVPVSSRLRLRLHRYSTFSTEHTANLSRQLDLGLIMHQLLQKVRIQGDEHAAIEDLIRTGVIRPEQKQQLDEEFQRFWHLVEPTNWFSPEARVLCEQEILLPDASVRRPDRLVLWGKHAVVIDYKFGSKKLPAYQEQVRGYMQLLRQMNFTVEAYLCYVTLGLIEPVE